MASDPQVGSQFEDEPLFRGPVGEGITFVNDNKDAFDLWWEWAEKPLDSPLTIDAEIHEAVMALPPDERRDRAKVNEAVRDGLRLG
jgi:hypothetical protein